MQLPDGFSLQEAVTLPNNLVAVFHAVTKDLDLPLPWPRPEPANPTHANGPILIWGGSSSVGQYALQIITYWGYRNLITTASPQHHKLMRSLGASHVYDYRQTDVATTILTAALDSGCANEASIPFILDCLGSKHGSIDPIAEIAQNGTRVAVLLPVILREATVDVAPEYSLDARGATNWRPGVDVRGVRTHFYLEVC